VAAASRVARGLRERLHQRRRPRSTSARAGASASRRRRAARPSSPSTSPTRRSPCPTPAPVLPASYDGGAAWRPWLVTDQRDASGRPDVATFVSDVLSAPVKISGRAGREPRRFHERDRLRLGREADRRLAARGGRAAGDGRL
jgi:hypothetical protein